MGRAEPYASSIAVDGVGRISALLLETPAARACYVLGHGAGAGMNHPFMAKVADGLASRGVATLRFQFPYMERGSRRPDPPIIAQNTVRAAVDEASELGLPLFAGGKSYGGRMTSQAQAADPLPGVRGLAFLGFPLHPSGRLSRDRARHLCEVRLPMLFLQGTRDPLADLNELDAVVKPLGGRATLELFADADHSFHMLARSGRTDSEVMTDMLDKLAAWIDAVLASGPASSPHRNTSA
jgi:uncharacterized protein